MLENFASTLAEVVGKTKVRHVIVTSMGELMGLKGVLVNFVVRRGEVTRVDGPYAEGKEVVGGWSLLEYPSLEEAVADQRLFAELHAKHWPEVTVVATLRQVSGGPDVPGD